MRGEQRVPCGSDTPPGIFLPRGRKCSQAQAIHKFAGRIRRLYVRMYVLRFRVGGFLRLARLASKVIPKSTLCIRWVRVRMYIRWIFIPRFWSWFAFHRNLSTNLPHAFVECVWACTFGYIWCRVPWPSLLRTPSYPQIDPMYLVSVCSHVHSVYIFVASYVVHRIRSTHKLIKCMCIVYVHMFVRWYYGVTNGCLHTNFSTFWVLVVWEIKHFEFKLHIIVFPRFINGSGTTSTPNWTHHNTR